VLSVSLSEVAEELSVAAVVFAASSVAVESAAAATALSAAVYVLVAFRNAASSQ
jgi:hypothetical protein